MHVLPVESAKQPGMKLSGAWLKVIIDSITESFQVSVIFKEEYTKGLANGNSAKEKVWKHCYLANGRPVFKRTKNFVYERQSIDSNRYFDVIACTNGQKV